MDYRVIQSPTKGTVEALSKRVNPAAFQTVEKFDAIGLIQGRMLDMFYAMDIAEKSAGVTVLDVKGSCPQNMILIAVFGDIASVESALEAVKKALKKER